MKKISLLAIALLAGLPGCVCRKQQDAERLRREPIEQYMDAPDADGIEEYDFDVQVDEDDMDDMDKMDEDENIFVRLNKGEDEEDLDLDEIDLSDLDEFEDMETDEFAWIDAQSDDEFRKLYFSFNHYGIRADQKEALSYDIEQVKQLLAESGATQPTVVVEGHACQEGTPAYNLALSERRAKAVADLFVAAGVDKNVIKVVGRGQECPTVINGKVVNGSRAEREPNRRVEVRVIYT